MCLSSYPTSATVRVTDVALPLPCPAPRADLEEKLHVGAAEVVGEEELPQDVHGQGDAAQDLLDLPLQAFQHLLRAQEGSSLGWKSRRAA